MYMLYNSLLCNEINNTSDYFGYNVVPLWCSWTEIIGGFFMGLERRSNGYFYIRVQMNGVRRKFSLGTKDSKLAELLYHNYLMEKVKDQIPSNHKKEDQPKALDSTSEIINKLAEALSSLLNGDTQSHQKTRTSDEARTIISDYEAYIHICEMKKYAKPSIMVKKKNLELLNKNGINTYHDFSQNNIIALYNHLERDYSNDSLRKFVAETKAFLNYSIKNGYFTRPEYEKLEFPVFQTAHRETIIAEQDFKVICDEIAIKGDMDFLYFLKFLWYIGCRPGEALILKAKDVDLDNQVITIFQNKTKKRIMSVIPISFMDEMKILVMNSKKYNGYLFFGSSRNMEYYSKKFVKLKKRLELNLKYNLYTFRHTFATRLLNSTGDLELVSKALGHSDVSITAKHYINRSFDDRKIKINSAFS